MIIFAIILIIVGASQLGLTLATCDRIGALLTTTCTISGVSAIGTGAHTLLAVVWGVY